MLLLMVIRPGRTAPEMVTAVFEGVSLKSTGSPAWKLVLAPDAASNGRFVAEVFQILVPLA